MSFFAPAASAMFRQLEGYGLDPDALFRKAGLDPDLLFDPGARLPFQTLDQLFCQAAKLSGDPLFGLRAGEYFRPTHLGALGFAWLASSSLRSAFQRMNRYARMINDKLTVTVTEEGPDLVVTIDAHVPSRCEAMREDTQLTVLMRACRAIAGDRFCPRKILYRQSEPADTGYHYKLFRCPIEFDAGATSMVVPQDVADKRLTGSNDELARLNEHIVVKYLAHSAKQDIVNRVKAAIIDALGSGGVTESAIAGQLHMTPRNLHRKLVKEDTSFKLLLNQVRQDLAQQYIKDRSMTLTEISFMLGFSEVSSFSRAYKNWTGKPPSAARQSDGKATD